MVTLFVGESRAALQLLDLPGSELAAWPGSEELFSGSGLPRVGGGVPALAALHAAVERGPGSTVAPGRSLPGWPCPIPLLLFAALAGVVRTAVVGLAELKDLSDAGS